MKNVPGQNEAASPLHKLKNFDKIRTAGGKKTISKDKRKPVKEDAMAQTKKTQAREQEELKRTHDREQEADRTQRALK